MDHKLSFRQGLIDSIPTMFGYIGIGLAFGIIGQAAGFSVLIILLLSLIVYAGAAQFIMVTLLATQADMLSIILAVFLVNSRMILLAMTTAPYFREESWLRNIAIGSLLTDESFALGMNKQNYTEGKLSFPWFNAANLAAYVTWAVSSVIGALLGGLVPNPAQFGIEFAVVGMFIGLLYLQIHSDRKLKVSLQLFMVFLTLFLFYIGLIFIPASVLVLIVTLAACGLGVILKHAFF